MTDTPDGAPNPTRRTLRWILAGQLALALLLIVIDIAPTVPRLFSPTTAPELDAPTAPGDQTRRYRPRTPTQPGRGVDPDMPRRLVAQEITVDGAPALELRGAIAPGDGARVAEQLRQERPALVTLDSPGGSVRDALELGRIVREIGARTRLIEQADCLSACPYVFVGGTERTIAESARLGVHQHSFGESEILPAFLAVEDIQRGQAEVMAHLDAMGVDLRIMRPTMATPADEIYILTADELRDWNVVTP